MAPYSAEDAKGLLKAAIRDDNPVKQNCGVMLEVYLKKRSNEGAKSVISSVIDVFKLPFGAKWRIGLKWLFT
ncbi:unnamed protein product [Strongylus vulgaris]|uniref:Uncharacterized protein n=1 Tax=Strongylus vulgaris TaxID=40348 RepID=A0A3P7JXZ8_STRVU|nr:unnamed protein product [Strongylus vulgaris]